MDVVVGSRTPYPVDRCAGSSSMGHFLPPALDHSRIPRSVAGWGYSRTLVVQTQTHQSGMNTVPVATTTRAEENHGTRARVGTKLNPIRDRPMTPRFHASRTIRARRVRS